MVAGWIETASWALLMSPSMGCLSADPASVAGGVGTGGRDRGKHPLRNRCDVGGAGACFYWVVTRQMPTALMARWTVVIPTGVGDTTSKSTSVPCGMTDS